MCKELFGTYLVVHPANLVYNLGQTQRRGPMAIRLRELTAAEQRMIERLSSSRTAPPRHVERARIILYARQGLDAPAIAEQLQIHAQTARTWIKRFNSS